MRTEALRMLGEAHRGIGALIAACPSRQRTRRRGSNQRANARCPPVGRDRASDRQRLQRQIQMLDGMERKLAGVIRSRDGLASSLAQARGELRQLRTDRPPGDDVMRVGIDLGTAYSLISRLEPGQGPILCRIMSSTTSSTHRLPYLLPGDALSSARWPSLLVEQDPELRIIRFFKRHLGESVPLFFDDRGASWAPEAIAALVLASSVSMPKASLRPQWRAV